MEQSLHSAWSKLLKDLKLTSFYPGKISLQDVMSLDPKCHPEKIKPEELPWELLVKLVMMSYKSRDGEVTKCVVETEEEVETQKTSWFGQASTTRAETYHPSDLLLLVFVCSDFMLRQVLAHKLFMCRIAIPFLTPKPDRSVELFIWPLRNIVVEWKGMHDKTKESNLVQEQLNSISFIRLGKPPLSKSALLNKILADTSHNTFFNENCQNANSKRTIANGLVDISHYLPSSDGDLAKPLVVLNLHGNACDYLEQVNILGKICKIFVALVDVSQFTQESTRSIIRKIRESKIRLIVVLTSTSGSTEDTIAKCHSTYMQMFSEEERKRGNVLISFDTKTFKQKSIQIIKDDMIKCLAVTLQDQPSQCIEDYIPILKQEQNLAIDECNSAECCEAKLLCERLLLSSGNCDILQMKNELLPLQGSLWREWGQLLKTKHRAVRKAESDRIDSEMVKIRNKQKNICKDLSPLIMNFMITLVEHISQGSLTDFYLRWLKFSLDNKTRESLPGLRETFKKSSTAYKEARQSHAGPDMSTLRTMKEAENNLLNAHLGLEHLMREVAQYYECHVEGRSTLDQLVSSLPSAAANILLRGFPIELMDGDAGIVPFTWIKAVLQSVQESVHNKRVFVLSVIGIQGSGKSTVLNTMFGMDFAVSAGRCTRGIYAQLLPVKKPNAKEFPFDYMLVLDSEGLRAPELAEQNIEHDNELVTLVIGLSDLTLVNFKGENLLEVRDYLQIAVHAFLRMRVVHTYDQHKVVFLHQNVSAVGAGEKMMAGQHKLLETLDSMTKEASELEQLPIQTFAQVISFNEDKHVWYIPDLWHDKPPMGVGNHGYHDRIWSAKQCILEELVDEGHNCVTIHGLIKRIESIRNGVLADDFLYSFENSLAAKAHVSMDTKLSALLLAFEQDILEWMYSECKSRFEHCDTDAALTSCRADLKDNLQTKGRDEREVMCHAFESFIEEHQNRNILLQWKTAKLKTLSDRTQLLVVAMERELDDMHTKRKSIVKQQTSQKKHENLLLVRAMSLAEQFKGKSLNEDLIKDKFDRTWANWSLEITHSSCVEQTSVYPEIRSILLDAFEETGHQKALGWNLHNDPLHERSFRDNSKLANNAFPVTEEHIALKDMERLHKDDFEALATSWKTCLPQAEVITQGLLQGVDIALKHICQKDMKFHNSHGRELVQWVMKRISDHNHLGHEKSAFTLTPAYQVMLLTHVASFTIRHFDDMNSRYELKHGVQTSLDDYKNKVYILFKNQTLENMAEVTAADMFYHGIIIHIENHIVEKMAMEIRDRVLHEIGCTKYHLIVKILSYLAGEGFEEIIKYVTNSPGYAEAWITQYAEKTYFIINDGQSEYSNTANRHLSHIMDTIRKSLKIATDAVQDKKLEKINIWVDTFCNGVGNVFPISPEHLNMMCRQQINSFPNLEELILKRIEEMKKEIQEKFSRINATNVVWGNRSPYQDISTKLWGCPKQCPFCHEPCQNYDCDHPESHHCIQHRPAGIQGTRDFYTRKLLTETCNREVCDDEDFTCEVCGYECRETDDTYVHYTHLYKEYKQWLPRWNIYPDPMGEASKFWQWFMCKYRDQLAQHYAANAPDIPERWTQITKQDALDSLWMPLNT